MEVPSPMRTFPTPNTILPSPTMTNSMSSTNPPGITSPGFKQINLQIENNEIITRQKLQELLTQITPNMRLDPEVEDYLLDVADDFVESATTFGCDLAKHRKSSTLEVKDLQLHIEKNCGIKIPGLPPTEIKTILKNESSLKQRMEQLKQAQENQGLTTKKAKTEESQN